MRAFSSRTRNLCVVCGVCALPQCEQPALCTSADTNRPPNDNPSDKITIIGNIDIPKPALTALAKGPNFTIAPRTTKASLQHQVQIETAALAYAIRWKHATSPTAQATATSANHPRTSSANKFDDINKTCPFHNYRKEPPRATKDIARTIFTLHSDLQQLVNRTTLPSTTSNITRSEREAITKLRDTDNITVTRSDKGGEITLLHTDTLTNLFLQHLNDDTTYIKLTKNPTKNVRRQINNTLSDILSRCDFPPRLIYNLQTPTTARTQRFYALPKTHKTELKIRPIVSACGGIHDRLGWLLQLLLKPLLRHDSAHLNNTTDLLQRFTDTDKTQLKGKIPISFDVVSLYTNINNDEAIETAYNTPTSTTCIHTDSKHATSSNYSTSYLTTTSSPKHYLQTNPWSGNGQSSERNPCYFSNGPFQTYVHLPEPLPFTDHLRTLHRRHWNCCQQPKWSTTPTDIPQLQTPDYQVRTWTTQRRRLLTYPWRTNKARHWRQLTPQTIHEACFETTHITLPITPPNSYQEKPNPKRTATCHSLLFHWQQTCLTHENTKQTTT